MVTLEELAALDLLLWQRNGKRAAMASGCNQSTISRRLNRAVEAFQLTLRRRGGEWEVEGSTQLLQMERHLHQLGRLLGQEPLRLELCPYVAPFLVDPPPPGWILGTLDHVGVAQPLRLLHERVIDAWVCDTALELLPRELPDLQVFHLYRQPVLLAAHRDHPLARIGGLSHADFARFPSLSLPEGALPHMQAQLASLGFGDVVVQMRQYDPGDWEGRTADGVTLAYTTPFNRLLQPDLVPLRCAPLLQSGGLLLCRRDVADHGAIAQLHTLLCGRLQQWLPRLEQLEAV